MRSRLIASVAIGLLAACGGGGGGSASDNGGGSEGGSTSARFRPLLVGSPVPEYSVATLAGDTIRIGTAATTTAIATPTSSSAALPTAATAAPPAAPLTLINIWATWCTPCRREFPELERLHREYSGRGLRVVAVSVDGGDDSGVRDFVATQGATFTIARDPRGLIQQRFRSFGVPESYLIDANGTLLWRQVGELRASDSTLHAILEQRGG